MVELDGKVAVVTGSTHGIGRAVAVALAERGAAVVVSSRTPEKVERVAAEIDAMAEAAGKGGRAVGIRADVRSAEDCRRLVDETVARLGRLDILVNNAGIGIFKPVAEMGDEDWLAVIETNLNGVFFCTNAAIPHLREAGGGWVVNIGSLAGKNAFPGGAAYNASKFGLVGFTEALMQEVRHDGIRVSCIMPGSVATHFSHPDPGSSDEWKIQPEDIAELMLDLLAMPARTLPSRIEVRPSRPPRK